MVELPAIEYLYYCKECLRDFLFVSDIEDHQKDSGHRGISRIEFRDSKETLTA